MTKYDCDNCAACCMAPPMGEIVVTEDDMAREPRVRDAAIRTPLKTSRVDETPRKFKHVLVNSTTQTACPLLSPQEFDPKTRDPIRERFCTVYDTRPTPCNAFRVGPGDCEDCRVTMRYEPIQVTVGRPCDGRPVMKPDTP